MELESGNIAQPNQTPRFTYDKGDIITRPARHVLRRRTDTGTERPVHFAGHDWHSHSYPLLIHVISGSVDAHVRGQGVEPTHLSLPTGASLWLGASIEHSVTTKPDSIMLGPRLSPQTEPPEEFLHIRHSPALRETALLILASSPSSEAERIPLRQALDAELSAFAVDDFPIPQPQHRAVRAVIDDPMTLVVPLSTVAARHSMSTRHVERIVKDDLGLSFVQWRTRRRLNLALRRIRAGSSVASAARTVGYRGSDGLIRAIVRHTGLTRQQLSGDLAGAVRAYRRRRPECSMVSWHSSSPRRGSSTI